MGIAWIWPSNGKFLKFETVDAQPVVVIDVDRLFMELLLFSLSLAGKLLLYLTSDVVDSE